MPGKKPQIEPGSIFGLAVLGWAFPGVFVRMMPHLPPFPLVGLRLGVAWLALTPFILSPIQRPLISAAIKDWRCWLVAIEMFIYYLVATPAFLYAPVGEVALVIASAPLFAVLLRVLGRQTVTRLEMFGAFLAICGVVVMAAPTFGSRVKIYPQEWLGVLLAITAAIAAASYAIGNRYLLQSGRSPGPVIQVWLTFSLGLLLLPTIATVPLTTLGQPTMLWLIPLGALSTAMPTVSVAASSHRLSVIATTMINPLTSVCASIVAAIVIKESPNQWTLIGGGLVLAAVVTTVKSRLPSSAVIDPPIGD